MKTLSGNIKQTTVEMLILKLLSESDMYGSQIARELKKRSNQQFVILEGTMYPILYRLSDSECVSFYEKKVGVRKTSIYDHIEHKGLERLEEMKKEFYHSVKVAKFLLESKDGDCLSL